MRREIQGSAGSSSGRGDPLRPASAAIRPPAVQVEAANRRGGTGDRHALHQGPQGRAAALPPRHEMDGEENRYSCTDNFIPLVRQLPSYNSLSVTIDHVDHGLNRQLILIRDENLRIAQLRGTIADTSSGRSASSAESSGSSQSRRLLRRHVTRRACLS